MASALPTSAPALVGVSVSTVPGSYKAAGGEIVRFF
jgi:hypothetical protein